MSINDVKILIEIQELNEKIINMFNKDLSKETREKIMSTVHKKWNDNKDEAFFLGCGMTGILNKHDLDMNINIK